MVRKKFRKIIVNKQTYGWTIVKTDEESAVRVWKNKQIIHTEKISTTITPGVVRKIIERNKL